MGLEARRPGWVFHKTFKDCNIKKESKVDAYISVNFSHILTNFVPQKMLICLAFHRDTLYYCDFIIREIRAILVKLVRN